MRVAFVDLKRQNKLYKKELIAAIETIVDNAAFIEGQKNEEFEGAFARFCNRKYCVGVNSGTDALLLLLRAYNIGPGDEVITVPMTYIASAMVVSCTGATPVFVDVDPVSYTIDPSQIEKKITKKTKAIIPVHLYGQAADMDPIVTIAKKHNLILIEDCAQAHGALYKGKTVPYAGTGAFSFYPGKNLGAFGDGGAIVTDDKKLKEKLELLRNDGSPRKYIHTTIGYKSRLDTLQAAILLVKLQHLQSFTQKRRAAAKRYSQLLKGVKQIKLPTEMLYATHVYHLYPILVKERNKLQNYLAKDGIATVIHYPIPVHLQEVYQSMGFKKGSFPVSEDIAERTLSLPIFPEITDEEISYVCDRIYKFYF